MSGTVVGLLTLVAAVGAGLSAGVYLAFSTVVVPGLNTRTPREAIVAMNAINHAAPRNPLLLLVLLGTGLVCVVLLVLGVLQRDEPAGRWGILGAALYLLSVLILIGYHVPHNERLMRVGPTTVDADAVWARFCSPWMVWNHLRTLTASIGTVCLTIALTGLPAR